MGKKKVKMPELCSYRTPAEAEALQIWGVVILIQKPAGFFGGLGSES